MFFMDVRDADDLWNFIHRRGPYENIKTFSTLLVPVRDTDGLLVDLKVVANKVEFKDLNLFTVGIYLHKKMKPTVKKVYTSYYGQFNSMRGIGIRDNTLTLTPEAVPGLPAELRKKPLSFTLERRDE